MHNDTRHSKHNKGKEQESILTFKNNLFQELITNKQNETEAKYMRGVMKQDSAIEQEIEKFIVNMFEDEKFIDLVNKYGNESIIDKKNKAIIILGQEKEYLNIIANFLKDGELKLKSNEYGDWDFSKKNPIENPDILDSFNIKNEEYLTYKSTYLNSNTSLSEFAIDKFLLQRILSTISTKFILVIKNIQTSSNAQSNIDNLADIFEQFTKLLGNVDISSKNVSIVITDSPPGNTTTRISKIIDSAAKSGKFNDQQKDIINKIKASIFLLPQASEQAKNYKELLDITGGNYITPDENNKITVNEKYVLNSIKVIKNEIEIDVNELKEPVKAKWEKEKDSVFKYKAYPTSNKLQKLVNIIKNYKDMDNSNKNIEAFLEVVKELNQILEIPKSKNKLENFLNYLKHFSNIKLNAQSGSDLIDATNWFDNLFSVIDKINLEAELLKSFKHTLYSDNFSFLNKLNDTIGEFYQHIKNNKVLNAEEIVKIDNLKQFLKCIKGPNINIQSLDDITDKLIDSLHYISSNPIDMSTNITNSINSLKKLIDSVSKQEAKSLWKDITEFKSIKEINENFNKVIYDKLLHNTILSKQDSYTYGLLAELLMESHKSIAFQNKQEELYKHQLAEIYCQHGEISLPTLAISLYEKAVNLDSVKAHIKLGNIYLQKSEYAKGLKYLKNTSCITDEKQGFKELINEMRKNSQITNSELAEIYLLQAKYYKGKDLIEKAKESYQNAIGKLEEICTPKDYLKLFDIYTSLARIASPHNQITFFMKAEEYKNLALEFNGVQNAEVKTTLPNIENYSIKDFVKELGSLPNDYTSDLEKNI